MENASLQISFSIIHLNASVYAGKRKKHKNPAKIAVSLLMKPEMLLLVLLFIIWGSRLRLSEVKVPWKPDSGGRDVSAEVCFFLGGVMQAGETHSSERMRANRTRQEQLTSGAVTETTAGHTGSSEAGMCLLSQAEAKQKPWTFLPSPQGAQARAR